MGAVPVGVSAFGARSLGGHPLGLPAMWVADRGNSALYALDDNAIVVGEVQVERPAGVRAHGDGGVTVHCDISGSLSSARFDARGRRVLGPVATSLRASAVGEVGQDVPPDPWATHVEATYGGKCSRPVLDARTSATRRYWTASQGQAPGHVFVDLWVQRGDECELAIRRILEGARPHLLAVRGGGVWCVGSKALTVTRLSPRGDVDLVRRVLDAEGVTAADLDRRGRLCLATPGAIVRFSSSGKRLPGQGGFAHLIGISAVRAAE